MRMIRLIEWAFLFLIVFGSDDLRRWWLRRVLKLTPFEMQKADDV